MRYTATSLTVLWLIALALFVLSGSGVVAGRWLLFLLAIALVVPVFMLRQRAAAVSVVRADAGPRRS